MKKSPKTRIVLAKETLRNLEPADLRELEQFLDPLVPDARGPPERAQVVATAAAGRL